MLFFLTSRIVSSVVAFLYPGYASYKTLSQRPASEEELERWLMYWSVLGCLVGIEYVAEWLISWIPLYYTMKTLFLLYLALPQTRGSSYLYINHLQPFFHSHETQIDATLASFKAKAYSFVQERLRALWDQTIGQQQQSAFNPVTGAADTGAPPTLNDPVSGPAQLVSSFWRSYGPSIIASGTALLRQTATSTNAPAGQSTMRTPPPSYLRSDTSQSVLERRKQLEAELAALPKDTTVPIPVPVPGASVQLNPSRASSASDINLRERTNSGSGKFEEVEIPSDVEGYDVGDAVGEGYESGRPDSIKRGSWFGWGGNSNTSKGGYERVKSD
ncbi:receptor expression-enhancing protein 4 [Collybia nuda]|uniref:Protein YOP1 n=1 Tax=Collybia nuda TaxID=64659 RepID=A0A9P5Y6S6_9AGAR|nr:receptor expression-enhancing protein 4 [Collybia nuda]